MDDVPVDEITALVQASGDRALEWFRRPIEVDNKAEPGSYDPVTEADRTVEALLRDELARRFPDDAILGEEHGASGTGERRWVIDPIDGTRSFVIGSPLWGTLVGLQRGDAVEAGWMHLPALGETYVAAGGSGRMVRGATVSPLASAATTTVSEAVVCATHPGVFAGAERDAFERVADAARMTRWGGDCTLYGLLALGCVDLVVESMLNPYDIVALIPLVEAAGGVITDRSGGPAVGGGFVVAAATPELHAETLSLLEDR
jgi:histidinol phosphatase-like enzyme (inositol monophosphatase family)